MRRGNPRRAVRRDLAKMQGDDRILHQMRELMRQLDEWRDTIVEWKQQAVQVAQDHEQRIRALEAKVP